MTPRRLAALVLLAALAGGCRGSASPTAPPTPTVRTTRTAKEIAEASKPAIVRVEAGDDRVGTGFVIDGRGVVATNLHVVAGLAAIRVGLLDGVVLPVVRILAVDAERDLVLLGVDPPAPLPTLTLGDSTKVASGDPVVAIGNPLGVLDYSVSDGLISSVRVVTADFSVLQISAPISQGSSGGPLFDAYGDVIGVTQSIFTGGQNLNFAIPSAYVAALAARNDEPMSPMEFATRTTAPSEPTGGAAPRIVRQVPRHDVAILAGCADVALGEALALIDRTIQLGAPLYNSGDHEACARAYRDTSLKLSTDNACPGIRQAFVDGLARAAAAPGFTEQAWALRDTFDGVIDVVVRHAGGAAP